MPFTFKLSKRLSLMKAALASSAVLALGCEITDPPLQNPLRDVVAVEVPVIAVLASGDDGNVPQNTIDNNLATRWSASGDGQWIRYDLGAPVSINRVSVAWFLGDARVSYFDVQVSLDAASWTTVFPGQSSGTTLELEPHDFTPVSGRYVRIVGHMNSSSSWNSITEVAISSQTVTPAMTVVASDDDGNLPQNTLDNDLATRWSASGDGQWIRYDLGTPRTIDTVSIAWYLGDARTAYFDIEVASDTLNWSRVFSGQSSGKTIQLEPYQFKPATGRFVRIVGHMNSSSSWNSISEVRIHGDTGAVSAPELTFNASATAITNAQGSVLTWSSNNATSCNASGGWAGSKPIAGTQIVSPVVTTGYALTCSGNGGTTTRTLTITVFTALSVAAVVASADDGNVPQNTIDNNLATRWSASGDNQWIRYDLGVPATIDGTTIAWYLGDARVSYFDIDVSSDAVTWARAFSGSSSGQSVQPELYQFPPVSGRYVRIVGHMNSSSSWNSITEVVVRGTATQAPPPPPRPGRYVSPSGSASGDGTMSRPWDLQTALGQPAGVAAGDTIWVRGGKYRGSYTSTLNGTATKPIIVRAYPGERVTLEGVSSNPLLARGSYTWFWGLEITMASPTSAVSGVSVSSSTGNRFINLVIHDNGGSGLSAFSLNGAKQVEIHGTLSYNNGSHFNVDHGMYLQNNSSTGTLVVTDNVVFNNEAFGIHVYGQSGESISGFRVEGNVSFGNGSISVPVNRGNEILIGGAIPARGIVARNNFTYWNVAPSSDPGRWSMNLGYTGSVQNGDIVVENNYIVGGFYLGRWSSALVRGNQLYDYSGPMVTTEPSLAGHTWDSNQFYGSATLAAWTLAPNSPTSFAPWKQQTGLSSPGTYTGSSPSNTVVVRPNQYEAGRANIIVYNWALQSSVSVDLSSVLRPGEGFVVRNVQDFYGPPVVTGTYSGATLSLPMAGITPAAPLGRSSSSPAVTGPTFQVFVVMRTP